MRIRTAPPGSFTAGGPEPFRRQRWKVEQGIRPGGRGGRCPCCPGMFVRQGACTLCPGGFVMSADRGSRPVQEQSATDAAGLTPVTIQNSSGTPQAWNGGIAWVNDLYINMSRP